MNRVGFLKTLAVIPLSIGAAIDQFGRHETYRFAVPDSVITSDTLVVSLNDKDGNVLAETYAHFKDQGYWAQFTGEETGRDTICTANWYAELKGVRTLLYTEYCYICLNLDDTLKVGPLAP